MRKEKSKIEGSICCPFVIRLSLSIIFINKTYYYCVTRK
nr:MAG TPA: hypothetical protein [Caudoviricetes sp.]